VATSALDIVMSNDELRQGIEAATPLRRLGVAEDIAAAVLYLASPAGAYLTGAVLDVHGGLQQPNMTLPIPDL
jgi:7-alpha-hydroxysteroid dehydrogenase